MSYAKGEKDFGEGPKIHKIRITLTSRKVGSLEKVCAELLERAKSKDLRVKGPVRLPTKSLKVTTRKTPCGEGSKTWDTFEMRIHKRLIEGMEFGGEVGNGADGIKQFERANGGREADHCEYRGRGGGGGYDCRLKTITFVRALMLVVGAQPMAGGLLTYVKEKGMNIML
ncbi:MAG: hypothetical protein Q9214_002254 [Letrouitia sp. 1 TL-2023]